MADLAIARCETTGWSWIKAEVSFCFCDKNLAMWFGSNCVCYRKLRVRDIYSCKSFQSLDLLKCEAQTISCLVAILVTWPQRLAVVFRTFVCHFEFKMPPQFISGLLTHGEKNHKYWLLKDSKNKHCVSCAGFETSLNLSWTRETLLRNHMLIARHGKRKKFFK